LELPQINHSGIVLAGQGRTKQQGNLTLLLTVCLLVLVEGVVCLGKITLIFLLVGGLLAVLTVLCVAGLGKRSERIWTSCAIALFVFAAYWMTRMNLPEEERIAVLESPALGRHGGRRSRVQTRWFVETLSGYIDGEVRRPRSGELRVVVCGHTERGIKGNFQLTLADLPWQETHSFSQGDYISVRAKLTSVVGADGQAPDLLSYQGYLFRRGILAQGKVLTVLQVDRKSSKSNSREVFLRELYERYGPSEALDTLLAATIGSRDLPGQHVWDLFRETGTSHIVVISGFHVGMIFFMVYRLLFFLFSRSELLLLLIPVQIPASIVALLVASVYTSIAGAELPAVRSLFLIVVLALGEVLGRKPVSIRSFLLAFVVVLLVWPGSCFEPGCQLTFLAVLGLLCASQWIGLFAERNPAVRAMHRQLNIKEKRTTTLLQNLLKSFFYCLFAWTFTLPVQLYWFKSLVLLAPVYNFFIITVFSFVFIAAGGVVVAMSYWHLPFHELLMRCQLGVCQCVLDAMWVVGDAAHGTWAGLINVPPEYLPYGIGCSWAVVIVLLGIYAIPAGLLYFNFGKSVRGRKIL
jgi:ComEC/Rec2-related protein